MPDLQIEKGWNSHVIGIDEAGRGPWAGPVVVCALWLNPKAYDNLPDDIDDSKKINSIKRAALAAYLKCEPHKNYTVIKDPCFIDEYGVLQTTLMAMEEAAMGLIGLMREAGIIGRIKSIIDGPLLPKNMPCDGQAIVRGDAQSISIAGASIIAKHSRDLIMQKLHLEWPMYGWKENKGYGTGQHKQALQNYGISPHHRRSFKPIKHLCE